MEYDISIDNKNRIALCTPKGEFNMELSISMTKDVRKQAFELGYKTLYDVTNASVSGGIPDAYYFPRDILTVYEDPKHRLGKAAILYEADKDIAFWEFFEITACNAGANVKVFCSKEEAVKWLSNG